MVKFFLLQFACFLVIVVCAIILLVCRLHIRWESKRYERSRWLIFAGMVGVALQYLVQMMFGFRASSVELGTLTNILFYTPSFSLISMGIYNIEATRRRLLRTASVHVGIYAIIWVVFLGAKSHYGSGGIHGWLHVMLTIYFCSIVYCICTNIIEIRHRKRILEELTAGDMLPYVRYSHASIGMMFLAALCVPFCILYTPILFVIGPLHFSPSSFLRSPSLPWATTMHRQRNCLTRQRVWSLAAQN